VLLRSESSLERNDAGATTVKDRVTPRIDVPHQASPRHVVDVRVDAEIGLAANVDAIQRNEDLGNLPELDVAERDRPALSELRLVPGPNVQRVDGCAKDALAIVRIGDPGRLRGVEGRVCPTLDSEREPVRVDVGGKGPQAPGFVLVEIDVVQEDDDLFFFFFGMQFIVLGSNL
jgi:hypothetical protein